MSETKPVIPKILVKEKVVWGRGVKRGLIRDPLVAQEEANTIVRAADTLTKQEVQYGFSASTKALKKLEQRSVNYDLTLQAADSEHLRKKTETDELTKIGNLHKFELFLEEELKKDKRDGIPTGIIFGDLKSLKWYNDTYGHDTGDRVLKKVAHSMKRNLREEDIVCRIHGDEFGVVLPDIKERQNHTGLSSLDAAVDSALRVSRVVNAQQVALGDPKSKETTNPVLDIGVTVSNPDDSMDSIRNRADTASYIAKFLHNHGEPAVSVVAAFVKRGRVEFKLAVIENGKIVYRVIPETDEIIAMKPIK